MKKVIAILISIGIVAFASSALACKPGPGVVCPPESTITTWTDRFDPSPNVFFGRGGVNTYSFTFDITKDGFVPGEDWVHSYTIFLNFADDCDGWFESEQAKIVVDNVSYFTSSWWWEIQDKTIYFSGETNLNVDGTLLTTITRHKGDFWFLDSTLTAKGCDYPPPQVPEPATLILMGLGLLGLAGLGRRNKK